MIKYTSEMLTWVKMIYVTAILYQMSIVLGDHLVKLDVMPILRCLRESNIP